LKWLLEHGANPNNADHPLELVSHNYSRSAQQRACLGILIEGGLIWSKGGSGKIPISSTPTSPT
jgi:hypothetical protein